MEEPTAIIPYHDPFDDTLLAQTIYMLDQNPNVGLTEFPFTEPSNSFNDFHHSIPQSGDADIAEANHPFADPIVWGFCSNSQAGPSEFRGETNHQQETPQEQNLEFGNSVQLSNWPVPPVPYSCSFCQVLREIIHTNGTHMMKLEIHGRPGMICHAILENRYCGGDWTTTQNQYQMFDFCKKSIENVREFLVQYCEERKKAGYTMLQDPLLIFYEALCVGLINNGGDNNLDVNDFFQISPEDLGGDNQVNHQPEAGENQVNQPGPMNQPKAQGEEMRTRSTLAAQRERTAMLTLKDFIGYFHFPIHYTAKKMNVCPTVIKRICRKHGLSRWPYRKIKSIEKQITSRRESLTAGAAEERARAQADIESLQQELASFFAAFRD